MPAAIHSETPVKSTVAKFIAVIASTASLAASGAWYLAVQVSAYKEALDKVDARIAGIESFMRHEAVTQSQAERYASVFRWENRDMRIVVPDPELYRDKPKS
jgi:heme-degrading monooxygenase HmoA